MHRRPVSERFGQGVSLMALRVAIGSMYLWWGVARVLYPDAAAGLADRLYAGWLAAPVQQSVIGWIQVMLGTCLVLGAGRRLANPAILLSTALSAILTWRAWLDPFDLWIPGDRTVHAYDYPTIIVLAGSAVLVAFKCKDGICVDTLLNPSTPAPPCSPNTRFSIVDGGLGGRPER